jgi:ABC-type polysaccharide/polyol phosphate transport system ATPase subunit
MTPAIRVENLSKCYCVPSREERVAYRTLREDLTCLVSQTLRWLRRGVARARAEDYWALKDVAFEVLPGEAVGIIGRNGAGKSTLLRILSRITRPTAGRARIRGRVGSLLEVGAGFHPELTGRENIFLSGAILGMSRREVQRKFDEVVTFAEVERFLDLPVKRYSSGMYVRLAFAVAAHLESEVLLVDEVMAVGDAAFQKKCLGRMGDAALQGRTVVLVSHNLNAVSNLCRRALWLEAGRLKQEGDAQAVISAYIAQAAGSHRTEEFADGQATSAACVVILRGRVEPTDGSLTNREEIAVVFTVAFRDSCQCNFLLYVYREGALAFVAADFHAPVKREPFLSGTRVSIRFRIARYLLNPGHHSFGFAVVERDGNASQLANVQEVLPILIEDDQFRRGHGYVLGWGGAVSPLRAVNMEVCRCAD